jgi:cyanophycinase
MKPIIRLFFCTLLALPVMASHTGGHLILVGGGEKPLAAMQKFVELAGGKSAPIVVVPTASEAEDTAEYYTKLFLDEHGVSDVVVLPIRTREDADRQELVAATKRAKGVFFSGGDQTRILKALGGSKVLEAMRDVYARGGVIGGTSAGTACQSDRMITGEGNFKVIEKGSVELWEGLGFLPDDVVVDQHFIARQRQNRLLTVMLEHPDTLGVGVDEDTAIWVRPDQTFEVIGASSVMIFDPRGSETRAISETGRRSLLGIHGMRLHILLPGESFDLKSRKPVSAPGGAERGAQ